MEECLSGVKDRSPEATVCNSSLQRDKISQYADHRVYSVNIYVILSTKLLPRNICQMSKVKANLFNLQ